ncbi:putative Glycoside hydrolase superfamily [Seiridium unicorne]|uniref:alpha-L-fucosidase n=1 Tax=Seiridium unicorne TaxID=138068 RepID=A0ABR2UMW6_9PEZI
MMKHLNLVKSLVTLLSLGQAQVLNPLYTSIQYSDVVTESLEITSILNNRAFGWTPGDADFDGSQNSYPAQYHPGSNLSYGGVQYHLFGYSNGSNDNFVAQGQILAIPSGRYSRVHVLAAAESAAAGGYITAKYTDGSTTSREISTPPWWLWAFPSGGDIVMPFYYTNESTNYNKSNIFQSTSWLDSSKDLTALEMPNSSASNRLHIFAVSLSPAPLSGNATEPHLEVQYARSTKKYADSATTQVYEVTVSNVDEQAWVTANDSVEVSIESTGVSTVKPGLIKRLRPGDRVTVQVVVENKEGIDQGTKGVATARLKSKSVDASHDFEATFGIGPYEATYESIYTHESPDWYNDAKFGIFIHWGLYSIPAWGNAGGNETYAEWYWWDMNGGPNTSDRTYEYHLSNYGPNFTYDDFIPQFTAAAYNAREWVDLFADSGATYFVQVSKHHDGYALFDLPANVSQRTSVAQYPHRDFIKEIFDAAEEYQPQLHRAAYYSLPEWFHQDYAPYAFGRWPGHNATNPFTNSTIPYKGYVHVEDYLRDLVLPEMQTLAALGSEIMWCDIGGPNLTAEFAAQWYNEALAQNRQVAMNNRCGLPGDFDTPEYSTLSAAQKRKWESNAGMDPYSYGYNRATPSSQYMNASTIVTSLVDIVSKNGNYLLDIGPTGNGSILDIEAQHLRDAGAWIKDHSEAIFNTTSWFIAAEEGEDVRFTTTVDAFYILVMNQLNGSLTLTSPIPWFDGEEVTVVGGSLDGTVVPSTSTTVAGQPALFLNISEAVQEADRWTWVFKVSYD